MKKQTTYAEGKPPIKRSQTNKQPNNTEQHTLLIYDLVHAFSLSLSQLSKVSPSSLPPPAGGAVPRLRGVLSALPH